MVEESELPSVHVAVLDGDTLADLFRDLSLLGRVLEVRVKQQVQAHASATPWELGAARAALAAGQVNGVQIRYALGADVWCDTLMPVPGGTRLVRIREAAVTSPGRAPR